VVTRAIVDLGANSIGHSRRKLLEVLGHLGKRLSNIVCPQPEHHVVEWKDFERFKRFTSVADKVFYLEAPGHPTLHAMMSTGGVTGSYGTTRYAYAVLHLTKGPLLPGVEYTLRARNEVEGYRWLTTDSLRVARAD
jgi:hypothetical protein